MRVLVTGSEGFIGKNLVEVLRARGDKVITCDLEGGNYSDLFEVPMRSRFDEIYHLACVTQELASEDAIGNLNVNIAGARRMAELAKNCGARFVFTSSCSVYGQAIEIPIHVTAETRPLTDYAVAKLAAEHFVRISGANFTIFRLSNVYGPHQTLDNPYCGVIGRFLELARAGKPLPVIGSGEQTRDFTYVGDVVNVLVNHRCIIGDSRTLNVSHGGEYSILKLLFEIGYLFPSYSVNWVKKRSIDEIDRRALVSSVCCPTSLRSGLRKTVAWLNEDPKTPA